jgi:predicted enzyme related to lactoylglutathione lyase
MPEKQGLAKQPKTSLNRRRNFPKVKIDQVLTRIFIPPSEFDESIRFYENLFGCKRDTRFHYSEKGLELASVDTCLLISGSADNLRPFEETRVTYLVDSLDEFRAFLVEQGASILEEPKTVPTGKNMRARHPDGLVVEYVELDPNGEK